MRIHRVVPLAVLSWTSLVGDVARAEVSPRPSLAATEQDASTPIAIATNVPWSWDNLSFGLSVYVGLSPRVALRANVASYTPHALNAFREFASAGDGPGIWNHGRTTDAGLGILSYVRTGGEVGYWNGVGLEAGLLFRNRDMLVNEYPDPFDSSEDIATRTGTNAVLARVLVAPSVALRRHLFVSLGAGVSVGYEVGHETRSVGDMMRSSERVSQVVVEGEIYVRLGLAFEL